MSITVQCPSCKAPTQIPRRASKATCPKCLKTFLAEAETTKQPAAPLAGDEGTLFHGTWVNPYGAGAFALATAALLSASLVGVRMLTIVLAIVGLLVPALGVFAGKEHREIKDWVWFTLGSAMNGLVLFLALFMPGFLNAFWALDVAVPTDPDKQVAVPRDQPRAAGKPLTADDWVDAGVEAIRQDTVLVRVKSIKSGSSLQIHLEIVNLGSEMITITGLGVDKNTPGLTDGSGHSYEFVKRQQRTNIEGPLVFADVAEKGVELGMNERQDYLLLFEAPPSGIDLKLEVPTSAWGRNGRCKFRIPATFDENSLPMKGDQVP